MGCYTGEKGKKGRWDYLGNALHGAHDPFACIRVPPNSGTKGDRKMQFSKCCCSPFLTSKVTEHFSKPRYILDFVSLIPSSGGAPHPHTCAALPWTRYAFPESDSISYVRTRTAFPSFPLIAQVHLAVCAGNSGTKNIDNSQVRSSLLVAFLYSYSLWKM